MFTLDQLVWVQFGSVIHKVHPGIHALIRPIGACFPVRLCCILGRFFLPGGLAMELEGDFGELL